MCNQRAHSGRGVTEAPHWVQAEEEQSADLTLALVNFGFRKQFKLRQFETEWWGSADLRDTKSSPDVSLLVPANQIQAGQRDMAFPQLRTQDPSPELFELEDSDLLGPRFAEPEYEQLEPWWNRPVSACLEQAKQSWWCRPKQASVSWRFLTPKR